MFAYEYTKSMSKTIADSDEVYRKLKREKGDRSFSEVIAAHLESWGQLADVTGQGIFDRIDGVDVVDWETY